MTHRAAEVLRVTEVFEFVGDDEGAHHEDEGQQRRVGLWCVHLLHLLPISVGGVDQAAVDEDAADAAVKVRCVLVSSG